MRDHGVKKIFKEFTQWLSFNFHSSSPKHSLSFYLILTVCFYGVAGFGVLLGPFSFVFGFEKYTYSPSFVKTVAFFFFIMMLLIGLLMWIAQQKECEKVLDDGGVVVDKTSVSKLIFGPSGSYKLGVLYWSIIGCLSGAWFGGFYILLTVYENTKIETSYVRFLVLTNGSIGFVFGLIVGFWVIKRFSLSENSQSTD